MNGRAALICLAAACSHAHSPPGGGDDDGGPTTIAATFASVEGSLLGASASGVDATATSTTPATMFQLELVGAVALADGIQLHLRTSDGRYVSADDSGILATTTSAGANETFVLQGVLGAGPIAPGDAVWLKAANGDYVAAANGGGSSASADHADYDATAVWVLDGVGGPPISARFEAIDGQYVVAENGGGGVVNANRDDVGPWEIFRVDLIGGPLTDGVRVHIRTGNDQYLVAQNHGGGWLHADSTKPGSWETFTLHRLAGPGAIAPGDAIAIATDNGHYVSAANGGGDVVTADRTAVGPWETFGFNGDAPLPAPPSRDAIVNVRADFANLRDAKDRPMFTPFLFSLMDDCDQHDQNACADVEDWIARLKAAGDTHVAVSLSYDYGENLGWAPRYPIHGLDLTQRVPTLRSFLERLIRRGLTPILFLACDGHTSDPGGGYNDPVGWSYGLPWCEAHLGDIIGQLRTGVDLAPYILWIGGWDGCFPDWSPDQTNAFHTFLRGLVGPAGNIATEFGNGYIHMGGGGADWYAPGLDQVDVFFIEFATNVLDPGQTCAVQQVAARMLGPAITFTPGAPCDSSSPPFYLASPRPSRGPLVVVAWEYAAYLATRKQLDPAAARAQGDFLSSVGFLHLGNGQ